MKKLIATLVLALSATLGAAPAWATEPPEVSTAPPVVVREVAAYLYFKLNPTLPAAWPNSGAQELITYVEGTDWFTSFPGELPAHVCGPGWAIQMDKAQHDGSFVWPETIVYPDDNIGWPPLYDAKHVDLETLIDVPACEPEPTPTPTPTPTRTVDPTPVPPLEPPRVLAETGVDDGTRDFLIALGLWLAMVGIAGVVGSVIDTRRKR